LQSDISSEEKETRRWHAKEIRDVARTGNYKRKQRNNNAKPKTAKPKEQQPAPPKKEDKSNTKLALPTLRPKPPALNEPPPIYYEKDFTQPASAAGVAGVGQNIMVDTGAVRNELFRTGNVILDTMFSGVPQPGSRMPDPYTSVRTLSFSGMHNELLPTILATNEVLGGNALVFVGSGTDTIMIPQLTPTAEDVSIAWTGSQGKRHLGIYSTDFVSRPMGINITLEPRLVGPQHPVVINAFPILPLGLVSLSGVPTGWPGTINSGLTTVQTIWGGRTWTLNPGETVTFCGAPLDNRSYDFELASVARGDYAALGQLAWGGWVIWWTGMQPYDTMQLRGCYAEEAALIPNTTSKYGYPTSRNPVDPIGAANVKDTFSDLLDKGMGAFSYLADTVLPMSSIIMGDWMRSQQGQRPWINLGLNRRAMSATCATDSAVIPNREPMAPYAALSHINPRRPPDEVKLDSMPLDHLSQATKAVNALTDEPEIITPKSARRPSAISLGGRRKA